jgi:beta-lactamase class A
MVPSPRLSLTARAAVFSGCALAACSAPSVHSHRTETARAVSDAERLTARLEQIARPAKGRLGIAFQVLETGQSYQLRGAEPFPMASVYKLPIALTVLANVDRGVWNLNRVVALTRSDLSVDNSPLAEDFPSIGANLTIAELLTKMMVDSDNTASDALLAQLGGPPAVMANLQRLKIENIRVDRSELSIAADSLGVVRPKALVQRDRATLAQLEDTLTLEETHAVDRVYQSDPRDSATPLALVELLRSFQLGSALGPKNSELLAGLMQHAHRRLNLDLPRSQLVLHKTGTGYGSFNDVGIVSLPNQRHLALAVLVSRTSGLSLADGDQLVGRLSRTLYDAVIQTQ